MQQRTMFIGLIIAMIIFLGTAWYMWPRPHAPATPDDTGTSVSTATTTPSATGSQKTSTIAIVNASLFPPPVLGEHTSTVELGGQTIYVDLAENRAQQELGLGNRSGLGAHQGMLFIFPSDAEHLFWMKDMSFPIDMIWMSADGTVIYIAQNVSPDTYPETFGPDHASRYVLEVPANFAAEQGVTVGDKAVLP